MKQQNRMGRGAFPAALVAGLIALAAGHTPVQAASERPAASGEGLKKPHGHRKEVTLAPPVKPNSQPPKAMEPVRSFRKDKS